MPMTPPVLERFGHLTPARLREIERALNAGNDA
jgi:hypothetical protein